MARRFFVQAGDAKPPAQFSFDFFQRNLAMPQHDKQMVNQVRRFVDEMASTLGARFRGGGDNLVGLFQNLAANLLDASLKQAGIGTSGGTPLHYWCDE